MDVITTTGLSAASAALGAEVVERKGAGHPDTLADGVAEAISRAYSRYCIEEFGAILHHNTDKTSLLGGAADVRFGHGELTAPVRCWSTGASPPPSATTPFRSPTSSPPPRAATSRARFRCSTSTGGSTYGRG